MLPLLAGHLEAEQQLLGGLMERSRVATMWRQSIFVRDPATLDLQPKDFLYPGHAEIFETICALRDGPHHYFAVADALGPKRKQLRFVGGTPYLEEIAEAAGPCGNLDYWAAKVRACPRCGR